MRSPAPLLALALLAGCGRGGSEPGVGGVTADEAAQLNHAAEMLDAGANLAAPDDLPLDGAGEDAGSFSEPSASSAVETRFDRVRASRPRSTRTDW